MVILYDFVSQNGEKKTGQHLKMVVAYPFSKKLTKNFMEEIALKILFGFSHNINSVLSAKDLGLV